MNKNCRFLLFFFLSITLVSCDSKETYVLIPKAYLVNGVKGNASEGDFLQIKNDTLIYKLLGYTTSFVFLSNKHKVSDGVKFDTSREKNGTPNGSVTISEKFWILEILESNLTILAYSSE